MAVLLEVEEIAVGDWSEEYGTVKEVKDNGGDSVEIHFVNGKTLFPSKGTELMILQGGRFEHQGYRRPFLNG